MTAPSGRECRARREGFTCSRKQGHDGLHKFKGINGYTLLAWRRTTNKKESNPTC